MLIFLRLASMHNLARNAQANRVRLLNLSISADFPAYRMALDLHSNPGLKKAWYLQVGIGRQNPNLTTGLNTWSTMVERHLDELERNPPPPLTSVVLCGMP